MRLISISKALSSLVLSMMLPEAVHGKCPPKGYDALESFDFDSYASDSWYSLYQIPTPSQPKKKFFCVKADYVEETDKFFLFPNKKRFRVHHQAREGSVTGPISGEPYYKDKPSEEYDYGIQKDPVNNPAKLTVGPFAALIRNTNYWIVAAGTYDDALNGRSVPTSTNYEWVILTGGSAAKETENGKCVPKPGLGGHMGMWILARDGVPPEGVITAIDGFAAELGLDTTKWLPVVQEGCVFP